jgi:hypothetical protein
MSHWPHPPIDQFGLGTTLGQLLAHNAHQSDLHTRQLVALEDIRDGLRDMPSEVMTLLERQHRRRSLLLRAKRLWPVLSGMGYIAAVLSGKLGAWDAAFKILGM